MGAQCRPAWREDIARRARLGYIGIFQLRGRTGFDLKFEAQTACRGWFVGLVKNRAKTINADHEDLALAA